MANKLNGAAVVTSMVLGLAACERPPASQYGQINSSGLVTNQAAVAIQPKPQLQKLIGRWERPDGGYLLEVRSVSAEGKVDAGYFNPSPIRVERAFAIIENGAPKLFVLLRDANYPGCTYKLTYDAQADQLFGQYFQAAMNETYDVAFGRLKVSGPESVK